jgi:hypothetical protein
MANQLYEASPWHQAPWLVQAVNFDAGERRLTIDVDFPRCTRFYSPRVRARRFTNVDQTAASLLSAECYLLVCVPCVRLPDGKGALVEAQKESGGHLAPAAAESQRREPKLSARPALCRRNPHPLGDIFPGPRRHKRRRNGMSGPTWEIEGRLNAARLLIHTQEPAPSFNVTVE